MPCGRERGSESTDADDAIGAGCRGSSLPLDVALLLAAVLLRVALVLAALGVALAVGLLALGLVVARLLLRILLGVAAFAALLRLLGGEGGARQSQQDAGDPC